MDTHDGLLYELRAHLVYVKVGERSSLYMLRAYLIYVKVGEYFIRDGQHGVKSDWAFVLSGVP